MFGLFERKRDKELFKGLSTEEIDEAKLLLECDNQSVLYKAFKQVSSDKLRSIILEKIELKNFLEEIALDASYSEEFRMTAMKKANSQKIFEAIGTSDSSEEVKLFALKNIKEKDDEFWSKIIINEQRESATLVKFCISKIKKQEVLVGILEKVYPERDCNNYSYSRLSRWQVFTKRKLVIDAIDDVNLLENFIFSYYFMPELKEIIIKKIEDEKLLMKIYDKTSLSDIVIAQLEKYNYENSLSDIVLTSKDKEFVSRCISRFTSKEVLYKVMEKAEFWYATLLAQKRLKDLNI